MLVKNTVNINKLSNLFYEIIIFNLDKAMNNKVFQIIQMYIFDF